MTKLMWGSLFLLLCSIPAKAAIAPNGTPQLSFNGGAGQTVTLTLTSQANPDTNICSVFWCNDSSCATSTSGNVISITDASGNSYNGASPDVLAINTITAGLIYTTALVHASNIATSASNLVTVTISGSSTWYLEAVCSEWSGIKTSAALDQTGSAHTTSAAASPLSVSTSGATAVANELIYVAADVNGGGTLSPGSGYTQVSGSNLDEYQIVTTATTYTATVTYTGSHPWNAVLATYEPALPPPPVVPAAPVKKGLLISKREANGTP
jgi:hypothetical protein